MLTTLPCGGLGDLDSATGTRITCKLHREFLRDAAGHYILDTSSITAGSDAW